MKGPKDAFLQGEQIYLRGLRREDVDGPWLEWFNDQANTHYMYNGTWPTNREGHLEYYEQVRSSRDNLVLAICLNEDGRHIGNLGLHDINWMYRRAELGIIVGDTQVQGRGVATEALRLILAHGFNRLNLHKVFLRVEEDNGAARRAFEKAGFRDEGILRDEIYHHRRWRNSVYMGVIAEEFFQQFPEYDGEGA